MQCIVTYAAGT